MAAGCHEYGHAVVSLLWGWANAAAALDRGRYSVARLSPDVGRWARNTSTFERACVNTKAGRADHPEVPANRCSHIIMENGAAVGVSGAGAGGGTAARGTPRPTVISRRILTASTVGRGASGRDRGDFDLVRQVWPTDRPWPAPNEMNRRVPPMSTGHDRHQARPRAGRLDHNDRMWQL